jgi:GNAT superfamily N-acetyltransferase
MNITILGSETDKLGNTVTIKKCDTLAHSPIYTFFLRNLAETIDKGFGYPVTSWEDDQCEAVYAELDGKILGHIVYSKLNGGTLFIKLSAVEKEFRKNGIYTILHKYFEDVARDYGCVAISSLVHKTNSVRLESIKKFDLMPEFCFMAKRL